ncbi:hypothetical protein ACHFCA_00800 [Delftia tsuruhatensis]
MGRYRKPGQHVGLLAQQIVGQAAHEPYAAGHARRFLGFQQPAQRRRRQGAQALRVDQQPGGRHLHQCRHRMRQQVVQRRGRNAGRVRDQRCLVREEGLHRIADVGQRSAVRIQRGQRRQQGQGHGGAIGIEQQGQCLRARAGGGRQQQGRHQLGIARGGCAVARQPGAQVAGGRPLAALRKRQQPGAARRIVGESDHALLGNLQAQGGGGRIGLVQQRRGGRRIQAVQKGLLVLQSARERPQQQRGLRAAHQLQQPLGVGIPQGREPFHALRGQLLQVQRLVGVPAMGACRGMQLWPARQQQPGGEQPARFGQAAGARGSLARAAAVHGLEQGRGLRGAFAVPGRDHAPQLAPAAQAQVQGGVAAEDGTLVARAIEAGMQHGQQGVVAPPLGTLVDAPYGRPPGACERDALHPGQQLPVDGAIVRAQRIGRQQRLGREGVEHGLLRLRAVLRRGGACLLFPLCPLLPLYPLLPLIPVLLQRRMALLRREQRQPGLVRQVARGLAGAALRQRLHGHRRAAIAQAAHQIGQAVVEQVVARAQQGHQARHLRMQQALGAAAARGIRIFRQAPHQARLLACGHQPPGIAVQAPAQGRYGGGLHGRLRQLWRLRRRFLGVASQGQGLHAIQLGKTSLGLQHIAGRQALAQIGQCALACRLQCQRQRGQRAVIDLRDDAGLPLRDLQGHDMARRRVAPLRVQGHQRHGADAFIASLRAGQYGLSKQVHAAGIQCFSIWGWLAGTTGAAKCSRPSFPAGQRRVRWHRSVVPRCPAGAARRVPAALPMAAALVRSGH